MGGIHDESSLERGFTEKGGEPGAAQIDARDYAREKSDCKQERQNAGTSETRQGKRLRKRVGGEKRREEFLRPLTEL